MYWYHKKLFLNLNSHSAKGIQLSQEPVLQWEEFSTKNAKEIVIKPPETIYSGDEDPVAITFFYCIKNKWREADNEWLEIQM